MAPVHQPHPSTEVIHQKRVCVIGAPLSRGQSLGGVDKAPATLRENGLANVVKSLGWEMADNGDLKFRQKGGEDIAPSCLAKKPVLRSIPAEKYTEAEVPNQALIGEACGQIAEAVFNAAKQNQFVITLGGDHSIAAGTIAGMLSVHSDLVVVWIDAHGDINIPETSPSRLYHGMPVAHLMGWFRKHLPAFGWLDSVPVLEEQSLAFIGLRDIDSAERELINASKVNAFSMRTIDAVGIAETVRRALHGIDPENKRPIHISFDIDGCDPFIAPGTGTRARGGLSYREVHYICETLQKTGRLVSMDLVEINPDLDKPDEFLHGDDPLISATATQTVRLGLEIISTVLGKVIL